MRISLAPSHGPASSPGHRRAPGAVPGASPTASAGPRAVTHGACADRMHMHEHNAKRGIPVPTAPAAPEEELQVTVTPQEFLKNPFEV